MSAIAKKFSLALASQQSGDPATAEQGYRRILAKAPRDSAALYQLGVVLHRQSRMEEARKVLVKAVENAPGFFEAHFSLGALLMEMGSNEEAETTFRRVLSLRPKMQQAQICLGELLVLRGKYTEAMSLLRRAIQLDDNDSQAWGLLFEAHNQIIARDGSDYNHLQMAEQLYLLYRINPELAREHTRHWMDAYPINQKALLRLGELLVFQENYTEAVPLLRRAIQLRDSDSKAWIALAEALRHLELFEEAFETQSRALALDDSNDNHWQMADLIYLLYRHNPELARQYVSRWIAAYPNSSVAQHIGTAVLELPAPDRAGAHNWMDAYPNNEIALLRLGELLVLQGKYTEAVTLLRRAIQLREDDSRAWIALAKAFVHLNSLEEAFEANSRALALDGGEDNHLKMADLIYLLYRHNPELGNQYARQWIAAYPNSSIAQHIGSAVLGSPAPDRASNSYVKNLFDDFAVSFEDQLAKLGYNAPDIVSTMAELADSEGGLVILDAGCGTGLAAASLRQSASRLVGVDLSTGMLEKAREKGLYDELVEMELGDFLKSSKATFDLIVASEVLNYFGNLAPVLDDAAHALVPGGRLAFSVECGDEGGSYTLGPHGRYSHNKDYIMDVIKQSGLQLRKMQEAVLRKEFGKEVNAFLILATKPA